MAQETYAIRKLKIALESEKDALDNWNIIAGTDTDKLSVRQAKGNIPNCEARIKNLEDSIEALTKLAQAK